MNVTTVTIQGCHSQMRYTSSLFQYDYGQILKIEGVELPDTFQAHFCNVSDSSTKTVLGSDNQVSIPDEYLDTGEDILCFIYLHTGEEDGETEYKILIPVTARQSITDEEPTPEEQSVIDQLVSALNTGVARAETAATNAETSEENAAQSELNAKASEDTALQAKDDAEAAKTEAEEAEANAIQKATEAEGSANRASASATLSQSWAVGGTGARQGEDTNNAKYYAESTISAKDAAVLAKTQAESARDLAVQAKDSAQASAQTATQKASEATQSANNASQSASSASASSTSAFQSAALATSAKEAAETAQGLAEDARDEAVTAKEEAETAQQEAEEAAASVSASASQITQNTNDISDLKSAVSDMYPTDTASGAIASFPDGANDVPVDSLKVDIEPVQDLNGYENPWPAGGGKNKLPSIASTFTSNGVTWTLNDDGSVRLSGTATANSVYDFGRNELELEEGTYFSNESVSDYTVTIFSNINGIASVLKIGGGQFTLTEKTSVFMRVLVASGKSPNITIYPQIEKNASFTSYEPYSNICPISGWTEAKVTRAGKNLCSTESLPNSTYWGASYSALVNAINALPVGTYTISHKAKVITLPGNGIVQHGKFYITAMVNGSQKPVNTCSIITDISPTVGKVYEDSGAFTITEENKGKINNVYSYCDSSVHTGSERGLYSIYDIQLELGSTATDYEPYQGETYIIELGDTIYGGVLDVTKGELTVDRAIVDLGTLNWKYYTTYNRFDYDISIGIKRPTSNAQVFAGICSIYHTCDANSITSHDKVVAVNTSGYIRVRDTAYSDDATFKSAMNGVQLCYELATPITISLTPQQISTLYGTNNIFADTGDTDVTYKADIQHYIQKKISAAVAALS